MNNKLRNSLLVLMAGIAISGCSGSSSGTGTTGGGADNGGGGATANSVTSPITIDNAGVVPIIGNSSTTSVIYVHNNTDKVISGITYSASVNTNDLSNSGFVQSFMSSAKHLFGIKSAGGDGFLDVRSLGLCSSISPGQSCPLTFSTPVISEQASQGSAMVTANYNYSGNSHSFNQVINYARVPNSSQQGVVANSGVSIYGFGNSVGYATIYMYGSGNDQIYTVTGMNPDKPGVSIIQGNITGKQVASNYVQAVEVAAQTHATNSTNSVVGYDVTLGVSSVNMANLSYFSTAMIAVPAVSSGAILTAGIVPLINSSVSNPGGTLFITNSGNLTATLGSIAYPSGATAHPGTTTCGATLAAGTGCAIGFTVTQSGGSGNITVPYTNGAPGFTSLSQSIVWYNGIGMPLLTMVPSSNPVTFNATETATFTVTVMNVGGYNLSGITIPAPTVQAGQATASASGLTCTAGTGLLPVYSVGSPSSCTYTVTLHDDQTNPSGIVQVFISGNYTNTVGTQTYRRGTIVGYNAQSFAPAIIFNPNPVTLSTVGDGESFARQVVTVTNTGAAKANITSSILQNQPAYMTIESDTCTGALLNESGGFCTVSIKLGPALESVARSGVAVYHIAYNGGQESSGVANESVIWSVEPSTQNLAMFSVAPTQSTGGTGESATPYLFSGAQTGGGQKVTLTYQNQGTNPITITGITNTQSPISWQLDVANSTCFPNNTPVSLAVNDMCTVVFNNVLAFNAASLSAVGATYDINITVPSLTFSDNDVPGAQFQVQPTLPTPPFGTGLLTVYARESIATITNTVTESGGTAVIKHVLTNGAGYSAIPVTSRFESYFTTILSSTSGCTGGSNGVTESLNVATQVCTLTPVAGTATESVAYTINPLYMNESPVLNLNVLFNLRSNESQAIYLSPLFSSAPLE